MAASRILAALPPPPSSLLFSSSAKGEVLRVTLNRPKAFNALSLEQVRALNPLYSALSDSPGPACLLLKGADTGKKTKAFCSGGDVRQIYDAGLATPPAGLAPAGEDVTDSFFREEYQLNYKIGRKDVEQVSVYDGITMGGGVGLSIHGKYRVATSRTVFAMPETGIGLFPDVGGAAWMPFTKIKGYGEYLGMTGTRVKGKECARLGLATHYVDEWSEEVEGRLVDLVDEGTPVGDALLEVGCQEGSDEASPEDELVERHFAEKAGLEDIVQSLASCDTEWSVSALKTLEKMSPTSLNITHSQISRGRALNGNLEDVLKMEFNLTQSVMREQNGDFYEGIRSVLVDKDNNPVWKLKWEDRNIDVDTYFRPAAVEWSP